MRVLCSLDTLLLTPHSLTRILFVLCSQLTDHTFTPTHIPFTTYTSSSGESLCSNPTASTSDYQSPQTRVSPFGCRRRGCSDWDDRSVWTSWTMILRPSFCMMIRIRNMGSEGLAVITIITTVWPLILNVYSWVYISLILNNDSLNLSSLLLSFCVDMMYACYQRDSTSASSSSVTRVCWLNLTYRETVARIWEGRTKCIPYYDDHMEHTTSSSCCCLHPNLSHLPFLLPIIYIYHNTGAACLLFSGLRRREKIQFVDLYSPSSFLRFLLLVVPSSWAAMPFRETTNRRLDLVLCPLFPASQSWWYERRTNNSSSIYSHYRHTGRGGQSADHSTITCLCGWQQEESCCSFHHHSNSPCGIWSYLLHLQSQNTGCLPAVAASWEGDEREVHSLASGRKNSDISFSESFVCFSDWFHSFCSFFFSREIFAIYTWGIGHENVSCDTNPVQRCQRLVIFVLWNNTHCPESLACLPSQFLDSRFVKWSNWVTRVNSLSIHLPVSFWIQLLFPKFFRY